MVYRMPTFVPCAVPHKHHQRRDLRERSNCVLWTRFVLRFMNWRSASQEYLQSAKSILDEHWEKVARLPDVYNSLRPAARAKQQIDRVGSYIRKFNTA